jgi:hypothetical protein
MGFVLKKTPVKVVKADDKTSTLDDFVSSITWNPADKRAVNKMAVKSYRKYAY